MYASKFGPVMEEMLTIRHRSGLQLKFIVFSGYPFNSAEQKCQQLRLGVPTGGDQSHGG